MHEAAVMVRRISGDIAYLHTPWDEPCSANMGLALPILSTLVALQ